MNNPVGWFEIYVDDMGRAKAFYESVLGVQLSKLESPGMEMWAFGMQPDSYGASGALVRMPGFSAGANSVLVYFSCADCSVEAAKAVKHGGAASKRENVHRPVWVYCPGDRHGRKHDRLALHAIRNLQGHATAWGVEDYALTGAA